MKFQQPDFSKYHGEWVISCNNQIIAHNKDIMKLRDDIKRCKTTPVITKIPQEEILIF